MRQKRNLAIHENRRGKNLCPTDSEHRKCVAAAYCHRPHSRSGKPIGDTPITPSIHQKIRIKRRIYESKNKTRHQKTSNQKAKSRGRNQHPTASRREKTHHRACQGVQIIRVRDVPTDHARAKTSLHSLGCIHRYPLFIHRS